MTSPSKGLSPRLRGNRSNWTGWVFMNEVYPAPAGEPIMVSPVQGTQGVYPRACGGTSSPISCLSSSRVYPRACGGTLASVTFTLADAGLSPRLRGNRGHVERDVRRNRSIPAPAGEPRSGR